MYPTRTSSVWDLALVTFKGHQFVTKACNINADSCSFPDVQYSLNRLHSMIFILETSVESQMLLS